MASLSKFQRPIHLSQSVGMNRSLKAVPCRPSHFCETMLIFLKRSILRSHLLSFRTSPLSVTMRSLALTRSAKAIALSSEHSTLRVTLTPALSELYCRLFLIHQLRVHLQWPMRPTNTESQCLTAQSLRVKMVAVLSSHMTCRLIGVMTSASSA